MERNNGGAGAVHFLVDGVELRPGDMFRVSGGDQFAQFIRITEVRGESLNWQELTANGVQDSCELSPIAFRRRFQKTTLKYQAIVPDCQWEAFAAFLNMISRWQMDRQQVWQMYLWFQDMAVEREMDELARRKEADG